MNYYSNFDYSDHIHPLKVWLDNMRINGLETIILQKCRRDIGGPMWCMMEGDFIVETSDVCGKRCEYYEPCNYVNGKCRHLVHGFTGTGKFYRVTRNGHVRRVKHEI